MYKQFILPALLLVFTAIAANAQDGATLTRPAGAPTKKPQATEKSKTENGSAGTTRTKDNLPKGAKVKQQTGNQKNKGKSKGHNKNKAKGKANGHHKAEGTEGEGRQHHQEGENGQGEKRHTNDGVEKPKSEVPTTNKPGTPTTKKPKTTTPETTTPDAKQRSGAGTPANSGGK